MPAKKLRKAVLLGPKLGDSGCESAAGHLLAMMEAALSTIVEEATDLGVETVQRSDLAALVAQTLEIARSWVPEAEAVLPGPRTANERNEAWRNAIANRMDPSGSLMEPEERRALALTIVVECARASGHHGPSALFQSSQRHKW
jgi:hypothetical protein